MNPVLLADAVRAALSRAVAAGDLVLAVPDEVTLDRPRSRHHGDYATPVALQLARTAGLPPRQVAEVLAVRLGEVPGVTSVDIAGPGFLNIRLDPAPAGAVAGEVVAAGRAYGSSKVLAGQTIDLEIGPADPTGSVPVGPARRAAVGDALGRVLNTQGATVVRKDASPADVNPADVNSPDVNPADVNSADVNSADVNSPDVISRADIPLADRPLEDLVEALGVDAARYALVRYPLDATPELDLQRWTGQHSDNPVYSVQYAHARLSALATSAHRLGIELGDTYDAARLDTPQEAHLIASIAAYPQVLATAAALRQPHRVVRYLEGLAADHHRFDDVVRVLPMGEEPVTPANVARLWLCAATRQVLANGLAVLGVSAPERM